MEFLFSPYLLELHTEIFIHEIMIFWILKNNVGGLVGTGYTGATRWAWADTRCSYSSVMGFLMLFCPLLHLFKFFHNKEVKNKKCYHFFPPRWEVLCFILCNLKADDLSQVNNSLKDVKISINYYWESTEGHILT